MDAPVCLFDCFNPLRLCQSKLIDYRKRNVGTENFDADTFYYYFSQFETLRTHWNNQWHHGKPLRIDVTVLFDELIALEANIDRLVQ